MEPTFPPIISRTCPTVIRDGIACGLIIRSGVKPDSVNGISAIGTFKPITPFCPCLEANLSPMSGILSSLTFTLARRVPLMDSVRITVSTIPVSLDLIVTELSLLCSTAIPKSEGSSRNLGGLVFPISTSFGPTGVSGFTSPSMSRFAYASALRAPRYSESGISNLSSCPPGYLLSSPSKVLRKWLLPNPLSIEPLLKIRASSILYPS